MLLFLDDNLLSGRYELYPWQRKILTDFADPSNTSKSPFKAVVRAANGSGKDKYIVAAAAAWLVLRYPKTVSVITSASGIQLDRQTNTYIRQLAEATNARFGSPIWTINYRHYTVNFPTENKDPLTSTIEMFATDEPGRAEGWHPIDFDSRLGIFTSESKSISEEIFHALARCTGFTHRVDVSSPGLPMGHFFNRCTSGDWRKYHITAFDCPHISPEYIRQCAIDYGESSVLYKSMILAEFGTTDEMVVIPYHVVWNAIFNTKVPHLAEEFNTAGLDLAAGGDEVALTIRNGNKVLKVIGFREDDTAKTVRKLEGLFEANDLKKAGAKIFGDAGGLGKPILDQLRDRGWYNVQYVLNNGTPRDKKAYHNRGVEMWFTFGKLLESGEVLLVNDERLRNQLSTRYYKQSETNKLILESKLQARAKGHPSPDRADSCVLAFSNYRSKLEHPSVEAPLPKRPGPPPPTPIVTHSELVALHNSQDPYRRFEGHPLGEGRHNIEHLRQLVGEYNDLKRGNLTKK